MQADRRQKVRGKRKLRGCMIFRVAEVDLMTKNGVTARVACATWSAPVTEDPTPIRRRESR